MNVEKMNLPLIYYCINAKKKKEKNEDFVVCMNAKIIHLFQFTNRIQRKSHKNKYRYMYKISLNSVLPF